MDLATTLIIITLGGALIGLGVYLALLIFKEEEEKFEDNLIFNFLPQYAKGHAVGLEVNHKRIGNRYLIEYAPRDINKKLLKDKDKIENVKVVIDRNKEIVLPSGTLSGFRNIKILLPPNPEDFPDNLKDTLFGQSLMELTEKINTANVEAHIVRTGSNRKTKLLDEIGDGEISEEFIERQKEINKELDKQKLDSKTSPPSSPFKFPSFPPSNP